jgi:hypothetical protein
MHDPKTPIVRPARGLGGTILGGVGGIVACVGVALVFTLLHWIVQGTIAIDRQDDLRDLQNKLIGPMCGCGLIGACAGFATWFPAGKHRFVRSVIMVFLVSVPFWQIGYLLTHDPTPHYKGTDRPDVSSSELAAAIASPMVAALIVAWMRVRGTKSPPPPQSLSAMTLK